MADQREISTEQKILTAATEVITAKGKAGTRMQEIADRAGVNKALLHYYFRSKNALYRRILENVFSELMDNILKDMPQEVSFEQFLRKFIRNHISFLRNKQTVLYFVISEIAINGSEVGEIIGKTMRVGDKATPVYFSEVVNRAVAAGEIRPIEPLQLLINILSLDIFFFVLQPVFSIMPDIPSGKLEALANNRAEDVFNFVWEAIKIKGS